MKRIVTLLFTVAASISLMAQESIATDLVQIAKEGLQETKLVSYHTSPAVLQVDHYLIPVSPDTHLKFRKVKGKHTVWFTLQNGTTVSSTKDLNWRRASFELIFQSKQEAKNFIRLFEEVVVKH